ncbi:Gfo/Idh/MocA family oxidoreductase [Pelagibius litoralis]|uniref:Gfo/Idh/MocA family oxidoreductase n=1 Tax=Pelagibius litoralis TaxID=374515 RepID=A0A967K9D1_9PROT|nr:Gfo/Idh/MocA family oxidoreductase [Pelagibius litoralis]NIA69792.1 Gfo/Idh/MocA family oxidoreductase [Pelagibius litoralis]
MTTETLRYGLIGGGMMAREHIANLALIPGSAVTAIADPDPVQQALNAQAAPGAALLGDADALVARNDIDAIVVVSPNHTHFDVLQRVFAGRPRPLLVEKPVVIDPAQGRQLAALAATWPAPLWVAMEYRYMPPVAALLEELRGGTAGRLRMLTIREHRYPFLEKVGDWNRFNANTGGTMVEKCCHFFDLMRLVLQDEPVRVFASGGADVNHRDELYNGRRPDILDNAYAVVDFAGGARAMLELCMFAEGAWFQEEITATGEQGRVACSIPGPLRLRGGAEREAMIEISPRDPADPQRKAVPVDPALLRAGDHHGSTYFQHLRFREAALGNGPVEVTLEDGLKAVAMGAAAEQSIAEGRPVTL